MEAGSQQLKGQEDPIPALNAATEALNLAENLAGIAPAKVVFGSVSTLLVMIRVRFLLICGYLFLVHA